MVGADLMVSQPSITATTAGRNPLLIIVTELVWATESY